MKNSLKDEEVEYRSEVSLDDLPDEVLEYIFKLVSPYADYTACYRYNQSFKRQKIRARFITCDGSESAFGWLIIVKSEQEMAWGVRTGLQVQATQL